MLGEQEKKAYAKSLTGQPISWLDTYCRKNGFLVRFGVIKEVKGNNVLVDEQGSEDWKWLPDMHSLLASAIYLFPPSMKVVVSENESHG